MTRSRSNRRWTLEEDRQLLRLIRRELMTSGRVFAVQFGPKRSFWSPGPDSPASRVAEVLGRSTAAVQARYQALRASARLFGLGTSVRDAKGRIIVRGAS